MIDLHSHILPGLDDGAETMAETLHIVRHLHAAGFHTLVATPHVMEGREYLSPAQIIEATEQVQQQVNKAGIQVKILAGAENYIFPDLAGAVSEGKLLTLGNSGKYFLVELPLLEIPRYTDQVFFDLQKMGISPVLAHPERYSVLAAEPERLLDWARKGVLFQLDLRSINGKYGRGARRLAKVILRSNLAHFIGTDVHRAAKSMSEYKLALRKLNTIIGEHNLQELTVGNASDVLEGKLIQDTRDYSMELDFGKKKLRNLFRLF